MKKVLALTLVLVLALSMSSIAFASDKGEKVVADDWTKELVYFANSPTGAPGSTAAIDGLLGDDLNVGPDTADGTDGMYEYETGVYLVDNRSVGAATSAITLEKGDYKNLKIKTTFSKGSIIAKDAKLVNGEVILVFAQDVMAVKDINFRVTLTAQVGGKNMNGGSISYEGTYHVYEESTDNDWFDFDQGDVYLKTDSYIRNMEFELGEGVSVFGRALKGVSYRGSATVEPDEADEQLMFENPAILAVYHLDQINIKNVAEYVLLNNEGADLYVYDGDFNYLGKAGEKLDYADTYYLAASELDIDNEVPDEEGDDEEYEIGWGDNSGTGGDDLYPENPHDNPGTGK